MDKDVLDAGSGVGYGMKILSDAGAATVTGVDIDSDAVSQSRSRYGDYAKEILEADLLELPFEDASFDVVICFETIEHVDGAEKALRELTRVVRPEGLLIVSSPNPDAYIGGNAHHIREFRPEELAHEVRGLFAHVSLYRQDAWVGSIIEPVASSKVEAEGALRTSDTFGDPPYSIVVASNSEVSDLGSILAFGDSFDVRWWSEQLARREGDAAAAAEREAAVAKRLEEAETTLLEANQELAQLPLLRHRLAELQQLHDALTEQHHEMLASVSWRITAPLRRIRKRRN